MIQKYNFSTKVKALKSLKKIKGLDQLPPPYFNYLDPNNTEFLDYASQIPTLKAQGEIVTCDHRNIAEQIADDDDKSLTKDIAFVGRSNVGKSSLVN